MSLVVNNNLMAANTARNLNAHYGRLATSTQRLSSGLRVNSAADDAAGLAIRELQRADIAALHQGARNANDAISMIQVADGSLGIIDEKLIRMKELAEQAATGTYDSTQRLMIESEYQAMASEITRIANATDFNGTKLLDGTLDGEHDGSKLVSEGKMKIHFGTGNDSAEDYYYVEIGECTSEAFGLGNNSTFQDVQRRGVEAFKESLQKKIKENPDLTDEQRAKILAAIGELQADGTYTVDSAMAYVQDALNQATNPAFAYDLWAANDTPDAASTDDGFLKDGKEWVGNSSLMKDFLAAGAEAKKAAMAVDVTQNDTDITNKVNADIQKAHDLAAAKAPLKNQAELDEYIESVLSAAKSSMLENGYSVDDTYTIIGNMKNKIDEAKPDFAGNKVDATFLDTNINQEIKKIVTADVDSNVDVTVTDPTTGNQTTVKAKASGLAASNNAMTEGLDSFWGNLRETEKQKLQYAWGQAAIYNLANGDKTNKVESFGMGLPDLDRAFIARITGLEYTAGATPDADTGEIEAIDAAIEMFKQSLSDMEAKVGHMDFAGHTIETQEDAQMALEAINDAIVSKDKIRAHLGAAQNRLENTVSNLNIQAENLQAAESRISDVDVATEMTQFVRNQILTQSAVAMLSQANSLPQMAMQLIGG